MADTSYSEVHAQVIVIKDGEKTQVLFKTTDADVTVDVSANSNLPQTATSMQDIFTALGKLAFTDEITYDMIASGVVTTSTDVTEEGYIADARVVPELYSRLDEIESARTSLYDELAYVLSSVVSPGETTS